MRASSRSEFGARWRKCWCRNCRVGWVEQKKRVLHALFCETHQPRRAGPVMGFAITREGRVIALPILRIRGFSAAAPPEQSAEATCGFRSEAAGAVIFRRALPIRIARIGRARSVCI